MTTKNTHTPRPWEISQLHGMRSGKAANEFTIVGASGCIAVTPSLSNADNAGNARLIAAAPDLLAALEVCATMLHNAGIGIKHGELAQARAAIAKARCEA